MHGRLNVKYAKVSLDAVGRRKISALVWNQTPICQPFSPCNLFALLTEPAVCQELR